MHREVPCSLSHCTHSSCESVICHLPGSTQSNLSVWGRVACVGRAGESLLHPPSAFHFTLGKYRHLNNCLPPSLLPANQTDTYIPSRNLACHHHQYARLAGPGLLPGGWSWRLNQCWDRQTCLDMAGVRSLLCWPTVLQGPQEGGSEPLSRVKPTPSTSEKQPPHLTRMMAKKRPFCTTVLFYQKIKTTPGITHTAQPC